MSGAGESWAPGPPPVAPDAVESAFEMRWAIRNGIVPMPGTPTGEMRAQPDAAGYDAVKAPQEPRRGSMRLSPAGGPQTRQDGPQHMQGPPAPDMMGPTKPEPSTIGTLRATALNPLLAIQQGVVAGALDVADPAPAEVQRYLIDPGTDPTEAAAMGDRDLSTAGRMRDAQAEAQRLGIQIAFRLTDDGGMEAVIRKPDMEAPGGAVGGVANAIGTLLGMAYIDPLAGAAMTAMKGARGVSVR